jgi:hypothetical protein
MPLIKYGNSLLRKENTLADSLSCCCNQDQDQDPCASCCECSGIFGIPYPGRSIDSTFAYTNPCTGQSFSDSDFLPGGALSPGGYELRSTFYSNDSNGSAVQIPRNQQNQEAFDRYNSDNCGCQFFTVGQLQYRGKIRVNSCSCYSESLVFVETLNVYKHTCDDGWVEITNEIYQTNRKINYTQNKRSSVNPCNPEPADFADVPDPIAVASSYPCLPMP